MDDEPVKILYELRHLLASEMLPGDDRLYSAFEYEYAATIGLRMKYQGSRVTWDLDRRNRRPNLDLLVVIAAILKSDTLFKRLLEYRNGQEFDHYCAQKMAGVSKDDLPDMDRNNVHVDELCNAGIRFFGGNFYSTVNETIKQTILAFGQKFKVAGGE